MKLIRCFDSAMDFQLDLDFSGGSESWFDFWHTHVDWKAERNKNWAIRKMYLDELFQIFNYLKLKLKDYSIILRESNSYSK